MAAAALALVDRARYPIDEPSSEAFAAVVAEARRSLAEVGYAELPGFITQEGVTALSSEAEELAGRAFASGGVGTAYLELPDEVAFDEAHPRRHWMPYSVSVVSYDLHPLDSGLRAVYESDELLGLLEAILGGDDTDVVHVEMTPGTLLVFEGRNSLHRVSPIEGPTSRLVSLLAFDTEPDRVGSELLRAIRYGRTEPFATPPVTWPL